MIQPLMTKNIRYGLRAVLAKDPGSEHPIQEDDEIAVATFGIHQHLSSREHPSDTLDFLRELLHPHHPGTRHVAQQKWRELGYQEILRSFPYPGSILPIILYDEGSQGCRFKTSHQGPSGGTHIGWAYCPSGEDDEKRVLQAVRKLEMHLNEQVYQVYLEENYQRTQGVGDLYNWKAGQDQQGEKTLTMEPGYPEPEFLDSVLREMDLDPDDLQAALASKWE